MEFLSCIREELINIFESILEVFTKIFKPVSGSVNRTVDPITCFIEKANNANISCPVFDIFGNIFDQFDSIFNNSSDSNIICPLYDIFYCVFNCFSDIFYNVFNFFS